MSRENSTGNKQRSNSANLYVKNFGTDITETKLCELFASCGTITSCKIPTDSNGQSKGFGFVNFERPEMAQRAMEKLNGYPIDDNKHLYVGPFQRKSERLKELQQMQGENQNRRFNNLSLYISNLDTLIDEHRLEETFSVFGKISKTHIMRDGTDSKGIGFVCFTTFEETMRALHGMNGKWILSKPIYVRLSKDTNTTQPISSSSPPPSTVTENQTRSAAFPTSYVNYPPMFYQPVVMAPSPLNYYSSLPSNTPNSQIQLTRQYPPLSIPPPPPLYYFPSPITVPNSQVRLIRQYPSPRPSNYSSPTNLPNPRLQSRYTMPSTPSPLGDVFPSSTNLLQTQVQSTDIHPSSPISLSPASHSSSPTALPISQIQSTKESSSLSTSPQTTTATAPSPINQTKRQPYPYNSVRSDNEQNNC